MDPVIIVPEIDDLGLLDRKSQTQIKRKVDNSIRRKTGLLNRLLRQRSMRRMYKIAAKTRVAANLARLRGFGAGPIAVGVGIIALIGAVTLRLVTGKTFGQMGEITEEFVFGDAAPDARAAIDARAQMTGNRLAMQAIRSGDPNVKKSFDMLKHVSFLKHKGEREIKKAMGVNNNADIMVLRGADAFKEYFARNGMLDKWMKATAAYRVMMPLGIRMYRAIPWGG